MRTVNGPGFLGKLGPFFALEQHPAPDAAFDGARWRNLGEDLADPAFLDAWVGDLRTHFATGLGVEPSDINDRAVASAIHLGLVSRLVSPWLALVTFSGPVRVPPLHRLWWKPDGTTRFPLATDDAPTPSPDDFAADLKTCVIDPLDSLGLVPSPAVRWGNVVSAVNGATLVISRAWPDLAQRARALTQDIVELLPPDLYVGQIGEPVFRRNSCCLINSLTPQTRESICGDCVHAPAPPAAPGASST